MILADTSVWVEHFRKRLPEMASLLDRNEILIHQFVVGELMLGGLSYSHPLMRDLRQLPPAPAADPEEVQELIERQSLSGRGIGYVDSALLAAVRLQPGAQLWTLDRKLEAVATEMGIDFAG